jgi:GTP diphosphokinase / guanosine-3',5'-bis(diphosphate) 3'-diphosphatase
VGQLYRELEAKIREYRPKDDLAPLERAYQFARERHEGQMRDSGEPYMVHPLMVAGILAEMRMDVVAWRPGCCTTWSRIPASPSTKSAKSFGEEVARCVDGVTKLSKLDFFSAEDRQAESFRKMLLAMVEDIRVIMVKLADRIHNMRTLGYLAPSGASGSPARPSKSMRPSPTASAWAKSAANWKTWPSSTSSPTPIAKSSPPSKAAAHSNEEFLEEIRRTVEAELRREGIPARIEGRVKRPYSVYPEAAPAENHRRPGLRPDGAAHRHRLGEELLRRARRHPQRMAPHSGPHQGFHRHPAAQPLSVAAHFGGRPAGADFEVQIRTEEMHRIAEEGIAAHWKYKEGRKGPAAGRQRIAWLRHLVEWQRDMQDPGEFMSTLKVDLYPEEAYTFTPKGKVIVLPREATPSISPTPSTPTSATPASAPRSTAASFRCVRLRNGDIVEIMTQPGHQPSKDWLAFVKTSRARNKIKHVINASERVKAIEIGEKYLEKEARRLGVQLGPRGAKPIWTGWPANTATRRPRTCTPRSATGAFPRARC